MNFWRIQNSTFEGGEEEGNAIEMCWVVFCNEGKECLIDTTRRLITFCLENVAKWDPVEEENPNPSKDVCNVAVTSGGVSGKFCRESNHRVGT